MCRPGFIASEAASEKSKLKMNDSHESKYQSHSYSWGSLNCHDGEYLIYWFIILITLVKNVNNASFPEDVHLM